MMLKMSHQAYATVREHTESAYPEEAAGFLLGRTDGDLRSVELALPQPNRFENGQRRRRYLIDPQEVLQAERTAEDLGLEIIGIFHSHPDHPAEPSAFDLEWSLPWYSYLITSVQAGAAASSRSWRLNEERTHFIEEQLDLEASQRQAIRRTGNQ
jgi:proteasome lid subunit RPN8/RPN11